MAVMHTLKQKPWIVAALMAGATILWMLSGIGNGPQQQSNGVTETAALDLPSVRISTQAAERVARHINVYGRVEPAREITMSAETNGRIVSVEAQRGANVNQGDVIVRIDIRDRKAQLKRAQAEIEKARIEYAAQERLKNQSFVSETGLAQAMADLEAAKAERLRIEIDIANTEIRAPFGGALQDRLVEVGDYVASGDPVATFVDNTTLIVTGTIAEQEHANVSVGDEAEAVLITGEAAKGRIRYISPVADQATRTFSIELEIDNRDHQLPAGVTAELKLNAGEVYAHKISPAILTLDDNGEVGIKTVDGDNRVQFHKIEIVRSTADGVWISGVPENVSIITVGQGFVKPGDQVAPVEENQVTLASAAEGSK
ncbi:MAG: efflux RND transporter periplasmic adaptor subunit [Gammaproteobacteria bacterium]|nr:efflux RND transporter periplasmic adaptor subunit [Gammaproteobacteria bacterium]